MAITRRELIRSGAAAGALLIAQNRGVLGSPLGPSGEFATSRVSRLFPDGPRLVHADLHNHTLFSDGDGDPAAAFGSMRSAGLDVAAMTDHSTVAKLVPLNDCPDACSALAGINEDKWATVASLADASNSDGSFVAIRGFEWSSPTLGHMNVWMSQTWTDPLATLGLTSGSGLAQYLHEVPELGAPFVTPLDDAIRAVPVIPGASMKLFYDWLSADPDAVGLGGGADGICGFNHPGREPGRFGYFAYDERLRDRLVSCEVFNRNEDYLFEGTDAGVRSPIGECLDAGWRVGLLGVTDEHGTDWGYPDGKGRTGLYVTELSRAGFREAMLARRFFSTRLRGLRFDAAANGVRMGGYLPHTSGNVRFTLDLDRGPSWYGRSLVAQVLMSGHPLPTVLANVPFHVPSPDEAPFSFTAPIDAVNGRWVLLRITDPAAPPDGRATGTYAHVGNAIAYAAPFYLAPEVGDW